MRIRKELLKGSTAIMILKIISKSDAYGYQITQELYECSGEIFKLNEGTLYPILHTLEKDGLIKSYSKISEQGRLRKYYSITPLGKVTLMTQIEEWRVFSTAVNGILREG